MDEQKEKKYYNFSLKVHMVQLEERWLRWRIKAHHGLMGSGDIVLLIMNSSLCTRVYRGKLTGPTRPMMIQTKMSSGHIVILNNIRKKD